MLEGHQQNVNGVAFLPDGHTLVSVGYDATLRIWPLGGGSDAAPRIVSLPTPLKAWIDRIAQAGRTFKYTEAGVVGLAGGKRVVIASSRGGMYAGTPLEAALDHQEAYLRGVFGFVGITDLAIVRAEGTNMGPSAVEQAMIAAQKQIDGLFIPSRAA